MSFSGVTMQNILNPVYYDAALSGKVDEFPFCEVGKQDLYDIFNKVSPAGNTLLHAAVKSGHGIITELIARHYVFLITKKNTRGDTPLHLAAKDGKLDTITVLVDRSTHIATTSEEEENLLKMRNDRGNTALHEALISLHDLVKCKINAPLNTSVDSLVATARYLVSSDPTVSYCRNNTGKSPLCLAVESENVDILEYILKALPKCDGSDYVTWSRGKSLVHIAIKQRKLDALKLINQQKPELFLLRDEKENTPLHCAALEGYFDKVCYLLETNSDDAFEKNKDGLLPIHLACENDHRKVMKELIRKWRYPNEFLTTNGRNILHVAAMSGQEHIVKDILKLPKTDVDELVHGMDVDGNTPLHLAALRGHSFVVYTLERYSRSSSDLKNNQGQTAYDIALQQYENQDTEISGKQEVPAKMQDQTTDGKTAYDERGEKWGPQTRKNRRVTLLLLSTTHNLFKNLKKLSIVPGQEQVNAAINNLLVVAVLIMGAAFATFVQLASVFEEDVSLTEKRGTSMANLLDSNNGAMIYSSLLALLLLCSLAVPHGTASRFLSFAYVLTSLAILEMGITFYEARKIRLDKIPSSFRSFRPTSLIPLMIILPFMVPLFITSFKFQPNASAITVMWEIVGARLEMGLRSTILNSMQSK